MKREMPSLCAGGVGCTVSNSHSISQSVSQSVSQSISHSGPAAKFCHDGIHFSISV